MCGCNKLRSIHTFSFLLGAAAAAADQRPNNYNILYSESTHKARRFILLRQQDWTEEVTVILSNSIAAGRVKTNKKSLLSLACHGN